MTRTALGVLVLAAGLGALACDGREVAIFDVPSRVGTSGSSGAAGSGGAAGGTDVVAGAGTGGSAAGLGGGGGLGSDGGSAGLTSAGMAGAGGSAPASCGSDVDCSPGWVCDKRGCEATQGLCVPRPPICSADPTPVCGCDGITYWNDCLRLQTHAQLAGPDPCVATACTCEVGADCKVPYASCSHLVGPGEMCGHGMGACWMLPPQCVPNADNKMWRECKPPDAGPPGPCVDTCKAIESEHSYAQLHRGDTCN